MTAFNEKLIVRFAYLYITLPFLIFIVTWLKWYYACIFSIIILVSLFYSFKENDRHFTTKFELLVKTKPLFLAGLIILLWVFFSGIGGYSYQTADHNWRNAIFSDLINYKWPVIYNVDGLNNNHPLQGKDCMLSYYIAFWLPAAVIGKIFGIHAANFLLYIWAALGIILVYYFICRFLKSFSFASLAIFILWGTAYSIGLILKYTPNHLIQDEFARWTDYMYYADNSTGLLYWVFNQSITPWLIIVLLLNQIPGRNLLFICSLCLFHGPLAFIGLLPFGIYQVTKSIQDLRNNSIIPGGFLKSLLSFQNILGGLSVVFITHFYFSVNAAKDRFVVVAENPLSYLLFILLCFGLVCILMFRHYKKEPLFYISIATLLPLPFLRMGTGLDFCARVSIPAMFILMLLVMKYLREEKERLKKIPIIIYLCIGAITPLLQITRSVTLTTLQYIANTNLQLSVPIDRFEKKITEGKHHNILIKNEFGTLISPKNRVMKNFMGDTTNRFFCRYLMKSRDTVDD